MVNPPMVSGRDVHGPRDVPVPDSVAGLTLVEVLIALTLLGFAALASASAQAWAARMTARAEGLEAAAAAAELMLDSLAALGAARAGSVVEGGLRLEWVMVPVASGSELRLHVRGDRAGVDAWFGALTVPPPDTLQATP